MEEREAAEHREGPVMIYTPASELSHPGAMVRGLFADVRKAADLAWRLARRDIAAQYRQSYLGFLWAFIMPLANTLVWILLNSAGVVRVADTSIPYPAYVFTGTMIWQLLVEAVQNPLQQVGAAKSFLTKLRFPREALILSGVLKLFFNLGIKFLILVPAVMLFGVMPDWHLVLAPVALLVTMMTGVSIGLLISPIGLLYTDVGRVVPLLAQFLMYVTPVVFAMPNEGVLARVFQLNPASALVLTGRAWLTGGETPVLGPFLLVAGLAVVLLFIGALLYRLALPILIERLST